MQRFKNILDYLQPLTHLLKGAARKEIPALAKRLAIDCIVMGTVARTGICGFIMGNTAETILEQIDCSVLAIKPPGFVTPVVLED
jgi:nucleotide-binding universal stress UspA family protein